MLVYATGLLEILSIPPIITIKRKLAIDAQVSQLIKITKIVIIFAMGLEYAQPMDGALVMQDDLQIKQIFQVIFDCSDKIQLYDIKYNIVMIRTLQKTSISQTVLCQTMHFLSLILKTQTAPNIYLTILFNFIAYFSVNSVLFLNSPLLPSQANQSKYALIEYHIPELASVQERVILIIATILMIAVIGTAVGGLFGWNHGISILGYLLILMQILAVPITYFTIEKTYQIMNQTHTISMLALKALFLPLSLISLSFMLLYTYFEIRPLRTGNILWSFSNTTPFLSALLSIIRPIIFFFDSLSILPLSISLLCQLHLSQQPCPYLTPKLKIVSKIRHFLNILTHISVMVALALNRGEIGFVILIVGGIAILGVGVLDFVAAAGYCEEIGRCDETNLWDIYGFYIDFKAKNKNNPEDLVKKISAHYLICDSDICIFKDFNQQTNGKITVEDLQLKISKFLKIFRYKTPESELLYQLWKIELGKTITLSHKLRQFSLCHKFIVQHVLGPQDSTKKDLITSPSIPSSGFSSSSSTLTTTDPSIQKTKFYKQLDSAVDQFQKMAQVMCKPLPELNQVIQVVIGIHNQTEILTKMFEEMIKNKEVNYFCIELYLKFFQYFLDQSKLSTDIVDRLRRLKVFSQSDLIQQNPQPCFLVQAYSKNIQKVNAQALKFLKAHRYQIKDKNFNSMVVPTFNLKQLYSIQTQHQKQQYIPIFFKIRCSLSPSSSSSCSPSPPGSQLLMLCRNIKMKPLQINNKNYYEITVYKKNYGCNIVEMLIDEGENIVASTCVNFVIQSRTGKIQRRINQVYVDIIKPVLKDVSHSKIGRIQFGERSMVAGLVIEKFCPYKGLRLLSINLIKKVTQNRNQKKVSNIRLSRLYNSQTQFSFYYRQSQTQSLSSPCLILQGSQCKRLNEQSGLNDTVQMRTISQKVNLMLASMAVPTLINYCSGIKVYRLYNNELYNIDLQDRARYEQQFGGLQTGQMMKNVRCNINQNFIIGLLLVIALLVTGCSIFLNVSIDGQLQRIQEEQTKLLKIQEFSLNFNRIMAVLRDTANGMYQQRGKDFKADVIDSYEELRTIDSSDLFTQTDYFAHYTTQLYKGSLSQLIQVCLTHVYEFIQQMNNQIIQSIHSFAIAELGPKLTAEKDYKKQVITKNSNSLLQYSSFCFIFIVVASVVYFIFFLLLSQRFKKNMDAFLQPLLITSQPEIRRISEQCQKFKNIIVSLYKNYEVDLQIIGSRRQKNNKRSRPKKTNFGFSSLVVQFIFGGLVVSGLIGLALLQHQTTVNQITRANKLFKQGQAVMEVYSGLSWITNQIDHTSQIDIQKVQQLSSYLTLLQNSKNRYQFTPQLSTLVSTIFFSNSCPYLKSVSPPLIPSAQYWCSDPMKDFTLTNPFQLSLDLYFRRMNYLLITNVTDTFASNGIYSQGFKELFKGLGKEISKDTGDKIVAVRGGLLVLGIGVSIMGALLVVILAIAIYYFKRKIQTINNGLVALSGESGQNVNSSVTGALNADNSQKSVSNKDKKQKSLVKSNDSNYLMVANQQIDQIRQE